MDKPSNQPWTLPNPGLANWEVLVGEWEVEGAHPLLPGPVRGRAAFEWLEGGAFLAWKTSMGKTGIPSGTTVIGRDGPDGPCIMLYYDERGVSRIYETSLEDGMWRFWRNAPGFQQRMTGKISEDRNTITLQGELSKDGSHWEQDLEVIYTRVR